MTDVSPYGSPELAAKAACATVERWVRNGYLSGIFGTFGVAKTGWPPRVSRAVVFGGANALTSEGEAVDARTLDARLTWMEKLSEACRAEEHRLLRLRSKAVFWGLVTGFVLKVSALGLILLATIMVSEWSAISVLMSCWALAFSGMVFARRREARLFDEPRPPERSELLPWLA